MLAREQLEERLLLRGVRREAARARPVDEAVEDLVGREAADRLASSPASVAPAQPRASRSSRITHHAADQLGRRRARRGSRARPARPRPARARRPSAVATKPFARSAPSPRDPRSDLVRARAPASSASTSACEALVRVRVVAARARRARARLRESGGNSSVGRHLRVTGAQDRRVGLERAQARLERAAAPPRARGRSCSAAGDPPTRPGPRRCSSRSRPLASCSAFTTTTVTSSPIQRATRLAPEVELHVVGQRDARGLDHDPVGVDRARAAARACRRARPRAGSRRSRRRARRTSRRRRRAAPGRCRARRTRSTRSPAAGPRARASASRWRTSVVLPEPRKPETSSAGMRRSRREVAVTAGGCPMAARHALASLAAHGRAVRGRARGVRARRLVARRRAGARAASCTPESSSPSEVVMRVRVRAGRAAPVVRLLPREAGLGVRLRRTRRSVRARGRGGDRLRDARASRATSSRARPRRARAARLSAVAHEPAGLALARVLVRDGARRAAARSRSPRTPRAAASGPAPLASAADLAVERLLDPRRAGALPTRVDAAPARGAGRLRGRAARRRAGRASRSSRCCRSRSSRTAATASRSRSCPIRGPTRRFANGVALCGGVLRPLGDPHLGARERDELAARPLLPGRGRGAARVGGDSRAARAHPGRDAHRAPAARAGRAPAPAIARVRRDGDRLHVARRARVRRPAASRASRTDGSSRSAAARCRAATSPPRRPRGAARARARARARRRRSRSPAAQAIAFRAQLERFSGEVVGRAHEQFRARAPRSSRVLAARRGSASSSRSRRVAAAARVDAARVLRAWQRGRVARAARRRRLRAAPDRRGSRSTASASPTCSRRARRTASFPPCALPDLARLCDGARRARRRPGFARLRALVDDFAGLPASRRCPPTSPPSCASYQRSGVRWLAFLREAGLGGAARRRHGSGQDAAGAVRAARPHAGGRADERALRLGGAGRALPPRPAHLASTTAPRRALDPRADVTLTSYALLRLDAEALARESTGTRVVLDEAQAIKNPDSQVARAAFALPGALPR